MPSKAVRREGMAKNVKMWSRPSTLALAGTWPEARMALISEPKYSQPSCRQ